MAALARANEPPNPCKSLRNRLRRNNRQFSGYERVTIATQAAPVSHPRCHLSQNGAGECDFSTLRIAIMLHQDLRRFGGFDAAGRPMSCSRWLLRDSARQPHFVARWAPSIAVVVSAEVTKIWKAQLTAGADAAVT